MATPPEQQRRRLRGRYLFSNWLWALIVLALIGVVVLMLVNLVAGFFIPGGMGLSDGGPLAILFSLVVSGVVAFSLPLDFDIAGHAGGGAAAGVQPFSEQFFAHFRRWLRRRLLQLQVGRGTLGRCV